MLKPDVQERPKEHRLDLPDKLKVLKPDVQERLKDNKEDRLSVRLLKKPEQLTCNRSSLDAIKRIEISNSHGTHTNHNRMVRYSI